MEEEIAEGWSSLAGALTLRGWCTAVPEAYFCNIENQADLRLFFLNTTNSVNALHAS